MPLKCVRRPDSPYWWIIGTIGGVRLRESSGTDSFALAEIKRAARENELYRAEVHGPKAVRHPFAVVALSYLEHGGAHTEPTRARVRRLAEHIGASVAADDIDQARIDKACAALLRPGAAPATRLREVISPARAILTHGSKRRLCIVPVFETGKASPSRTEWMTPAEVDAMIDASAHHIKPLLAFLAATGARLGEALSLDWRDVDLVHSRAVLRDTKNGKDRLVDLCPSAMGALESITGRKRRLLPPEPCSRVGSVFRTQVGEPYKVDDDKALCANDDETNHRVKFRLRG
jgi:integrase